MRGLKRLRRGASGLDYAIAVGLIGVVALVGVTALGGTAAGLFSGVSNRLANSASGAGSGGGGGAPAGPPDLPDFPAALNLNPSATVTSDSIVLTGFSGTVTASVSGGIAPKISVNGGAYAASASVTAGQSVRLRVPAPAAYDGTVTVTLALSNGLDSQWQLATRPSGFRIEKNVFNTQSGNWSGLTWSRDNNRKFFADPLATNTQGNAVTVWRSDTGQIVSYMSDAMAQNPGLSGSTGGAAGLYAPAVLDEQTGDIYLSWNRVSRAYISHHNQALGWQGHTISLGLLNHLYNGRIIGSGLSKYIIAGPINSSDIRSIQIQGQPTAWFGTVNTATIPSNTTAHDFALVPGGGGWMLAHDHFGNNEGILIPFGADGSFGSASYLVNAGLPANHTASGIAYDSATGRLFVTTTTAIYKLTTGLALETSYTSLPNGVGQATGYVQSTANTQDSIDGILWYVYNFTLYRFDTTTGSVTHSWNINSLSAGTGNGSIDLWGVFRDDTTGAFWTTASGMTRFWVD